MTGELPAYTSPTIFKMPVNNDVGRINPIEEPFGGGESHNEFEIAMYVAGELDVSGIANTQGRSSFLNKAAGARPWLRRIAG